MNRAADQRLVEVVRAGDEVAVARALADGADPNAAVGRFPGTVLTEAARGGRLGVVRLLVDAGATIGPVGSLQRDAAARRDARSTRGRRAVPRLRDPRMFHLLASVIGVVLEDLGDDEWAPRTGTDAGTAGSVARRLRDEIVKASNASWFRLAVTADELAATRSALVELAYGTKRVCPPVPASGRSST